MAGRYSLNTLGCKVNQYESQQIREVLERHGLRRAEGGEVPEFAVVNSCAVTARASAKTRQVARKLTRNASTSVVVVGCSASADREKLAAIPGVVGIWGHEEEYLHRIDAYLATKHTQRSTNGIDPAGVGLAASGTISVHHANAHHAGRDQHVSHEPYEDGLADRRLYGSLALDSRIVNCRISQDTSIARFDGHQRAMLKIQDGCDAHCTYCIIPNLRPTLRSKTADAAIAEARQLIAAGHREIVLTGIYLGAFGRPTALRRRFDKSRSPLAELVDALAESVNGLVRLRLSSLEPGDVDDHLLDVLAAHECCVPHLHLPLQSGSSRILRRMNRQYDADDFLAMCTRLQDALDRPAITTDIVVGFPGETDQDFDETLRIARSVGFCKIHAFPFSPRSGTAAARWTKDFIPGDCVRDRMHSLLDVERVSAKAFVRQFIGGVERVIVETTSDPADHGELGGLNATGRSDRYFPIQFPQSGTIEPGDIAFVRISGLNDENTLGAVGAVVATPDRDVSLAPLPPTCA